MVAQEATRRDERQETRRSEYASRRLLTDRHLLAEPDTESLWRFTSANESMLAVVDAFLQPEPRRGVAPAMRGAQVRRCPARGFQSDGSRHNWFRA